MRTAEYIKGQVGACKARARVNELANLYEKIKLQEDAFGTDPANVVMPTIEFVKAVIEERITELNNAIKEVVNDDELGE